MPTKRQHNFIPIILIVGISFALISAIPILDDSSANESTANKSKPTQSAIEPVDDDMHHFMEYVFEPNYKRLKAAMAGEKKDKTVWKAIKGDSLTLAECANLLLTRTPDAGADEWRKQAVAVRTLGGELYQAARKSDAPAARKAYMAMLDNCNACHKKFADGKHQLEP